MRGFRNLSLAVLLGVGVATAEPVTIAALGDSLTQGYGVLPGKGFVPQLQAWLRARGADVVVRNAGVSGDTTRGGLARLDWTLTPDVDAMIVNLGGNDVLRGLDPALVRANLDAILSRADAGDLPVLLIGIRAPRNYGPDYKQAFDAIYSELAEQHGTLFFNNYFEPLAAGGSTQGVDPALMQRDGIHPNARGVKNVVDAIGPTVLELIERTTVR